MKRALQSEKITTLTAIQNATWNPALTGCDVVGLSQTGSGKTLAFLLPALQRSLLNPKPNKVQILVISPTRELAQQSLGQAKMLLRDCEAVSAQILCGGTPKQIDIQQIERFGLPTILVATPGRLLDHMRSSIVSGTGFAFFLEQLDTLVLDEMDRLLGMGFRDDILEIVSLLPKERQTLLFSATKPSEVDEMIVRCVKQDSRLVDCSPGNEPDAGALIEQSHVILSSDRCVSGVVQLLIALMTDPSHKILVFFPTTAQVNYFSDLFLSGLGLSVLSIHSKMSQSLRTTTSERFRHAGKAVLFSTDISARGVDYPDVTHVVQVGAATDRETYIHRLGRTGRAGKKGNGILVLSEHERQFLEGDLLDLRVPLHKELQRKISGRPPSFVRSELMRVTHDMRQGKAQSIVESARAAYIGLLGYYYTKFRSMGIESKDVLVEAVNKFANDSGLDTLPEITHSQAEKYGLAGHRALNIQKRWTSGSKFEVGTRNSGAQQKKG